MQPGMAERIPTMVVSNSSLWAESEGNTALNQLDAKLHTTLIKNRWLDELPIYSLSPWDNTQAINLLDDFSSGFRLVKKSV